MNVANDPNVIWITWEQQLRNKTLSYHLGAKLYQLESKTHRLIGYFPLVLSTFRIILATRAKNIVVQNPSIVLACVANIFARLCFKHLIVDAHNSGLFPKEGESKILNWVAALLLKVTPLTIVTNQALVDYVHKKNGRAVLVPDPLPDIPITNELDNNEFSVLYICTWSKDEPYQSVIDSATLLPEGYHIYITGNYHKKLTSKQVKELPPNIILTGFVSDAEYYSLINQVDVTLDLTNREHCLLCGAYESVSVEKPMILSDTLVLREYFYKGVLYTDNSATDIADKIQQMMKDKNRYSEEIKLLKKALHLK
ncbi:MAG: glycosyltransferase [gamma proteobacterium symbiont of Lucinoma myriamae]|nr:glycosyltransferase [gamma proteobacterium symbiont of Lucinoma myriamae]MCU7817296.1 glycosyltransferase [gamma proteobacterium symbiont of Lucinoma myriamae]MCU7832050.1 glycosyltransferase [gamma proteobacterium symbiont of Lucinoma myriamae]